MEDEPITEIQYQNDLGDYVSYYLGLLLGNRTLKAALVFAALAVPLSYFFFPDQSRIIAFVLKNAARTEPGKAFLISFGFYGIVWSTFLIQAFVEDFKGPYDRILFPRHKITLSSGGLSRISDYGGERRPWKAVSAIEQNRRLVVIHFHGFPRTAACLVPKRVFKSALQLRSFQERASMSLRTGARP